MRIMISELTGAALDWAVTKIEAERKLFTIYPQYITPYSTDWAQGGPIIEREKVCVEYMAGAGDGGLDVWVTEVLHEDRKYGGVTSSAGEGPTPLIAAMRCYVASKLGDYIDIPEELTP